MTPRPPPRASAKTPEGRLLSEALALLESKGWCQGMAYTRDGRHCALAAIEFGNATFGTRLRATEHFRKAIGRECSIGEWNDAPKRRFFDIRRAFWKAIKLAEARK